MMYISVKDHCAHDAVQERVEPSCRITEVSEETEG